MNNSSVNLRKIGFKTIGILLFVASAIITIQYMLSNVIGFIACVVALIQGVGIESAKSFFSYVFITTHSSQFGKKLSFGMLALLAFVISIVATTGWGLNMSSKVADKLLKNSDQYKNAQNYVKTQGDLYEQTKKQLDDLKAQRDTQIAGMEKTRDSWGKIYKTQKSLEQTKINNTTSKYNNDIAKKESELATIAGTLNQTTNESLKTEGFTGLYLTLAKYINDANNENYEAKPTTADDVSFWLNLAISVCLEFFGIGFIYLSMKEEGHITSYASHSHHNTAGFKSEVATAQSIPDNTITSRKIGFTYEPSETLIYSNSSANNQSGNPSLIGHSNNSHAHYDNTDVQGNSINQDDLRIYLSYMYQNQKDSISPGYMKISKNTPLTVESCRKIKGHLERLGVVRTDGTNTIILKDNRNAESLIYRNG